MNRWLCNDPMEIEILCQSCIQYGSEQEIIKFNNPICFVCYTKLKNQIKNKYFDNSKIIMCVCCKFTQLNHTTFEITPINDLMKWVPVCRKCLKKTL